jgi:hypothetical protein
MASAKGFQIRAAGQSGFYFYDHLIWTWMWEVDFL